MCLGVVTVLLLNVMEVFSVCGGALLDISYIMYGLPNKCVCCACNPSERMGAPSICFVCIFVCRNLSPHFGV